MAHIYIEPPNQTDLLTGSRGFRRAIVSANANTILCVVNHRSNRMVFYCCAAFVRVVCDGRQLQLMWN